MPLSRLIARPLIATMFVTGGVHALRNVSEFAKRAKPAADKLVPQAQKAVPQIPDDPETLVKINAGVQVVAAAAFATGKLPRLSAAALAGSLIPTTLASHSFWDVSDPEEREKQQLHFYKNLAILGGLLIAAGDTEGRPSVAWRAGRAGRDARRGAKALSGTAKASGKAAKAKIS